MSKAKFNFFDSALSELEIAFSLFFQACIAELCCLAVVATVMVSATVNAKATEMTTEVVSEMATETATAAMTERASVTALLLRGATNHRCVKGLIECRC